MQPAPANDAEAGNPGPAAEPRPRMHMHFLATARQGGPPAVLGSELLQLIVLFHARDEAPGPAAADAADMDIKPDMRIDTSAVLADAVPPGHMLCPISLDLMHDPVVAADGHSYERGYIQRWLRQSAVSPKNNSPLDSACLVPNHNLRKGIIEWVEAHTFAPDPAPACLPQTPPAVRPEAGEGATPPPPG